MNEKKEVLTYMICCLALPVAQMLLCHQLLSGIHPPVFYVSHLSDQLGRDFVPAMQEVLTKAHKLAQCSVYHILITSTAECRGTSDVA